jgi:hypothetical protein
VLPIFRTNVSIGAGWQAQSGHFQPVFGRRPFLPGFVPNPKIRFVSGRFFAHACRMAKQVLGRNLEALQDGGAKGDGKIEASATQTAPVGSGVRSLMRGHQTPPANPPTTASNRKFVVPRWYLFGGDILLTALALIIVCKSPHPLSWRKELFCAAAVVLGGCLALGAVWRTDDQ